MAGFRRMLTRGCRRSFAISDSNRFRNPSLRYVKFLLEHDLGFHQHQRNKIFKVLTIASVIGIPPTLIASMYGMNFKNMPELSWTWGYQWGLGLIVISTVLPILWFKKTRLVVTKRRAPAGREPFHC